MSLSDVSSTSLSIILKCMRTDPRHIDSMRKTCKSFNQKAVSMGLDKANDVYLSLSIQRIKKANRANKGNRLFEKDIIQIRVVINKKRSDLDPNCKACCTNRNKYPSLEQCSDSEVAIGAHNHNKRLTHASDSENQQHKEDYPIGSGRKRKVLMRRMFEPVEDPNESDGSDYIETKYNIPKCTCKNWFPVAEHSWQVSRVSEQKRFVETFSKAIKRVKYVRKLKIQCWRLDDEAMVFLTQQKQLRFLYKLVLLNCNLDVEEKSFHQFIDAFPIKIANINCKFRNYQLDNKALHKIRKIDIVAVYGKKQFMYPRLTDDLLKYWEQNPPMEALFRHVETKFTVDGIIRLIEASVTRRSGVEYGLGIICITPENYRKLLNFFQLRRDLLLRGRNKTTKHSPRCISVACKYLTYFNLVFYYKFTKEANK